MSVEHNEPTADDYLHAAGETPELLPCPNPICRSSEVRRDANHTQCRRCFVCIHSQAWDRMSLAMTEWDELKALLIRCTRKQRNGHLAVKFTDELKAKARQLAEEDET